MSNNNNTFSVLKEAQDWNNEDTSWAYMSTENTAGVGWRPPPQACPFLSSEQGLQQPCRNAGSALSILVLPLISLQSSFSHILAPTLESCSHMW